MSRRRRTSNSASTASATISRDVATFPIVPPDVTDPYTYFMIETGTACIGTPDDAIAFIERLQKGSGGFGVIMELAQNWADWEQTKRHYELMARFVHPHFQGSRELAPGQLRLCPRSPRGVRRPVRRGGAGGDRPPRGCEARRGRVKEGQGLCPLDPRQRLAFGIHPFVWECKEGLLRPCAVSVGPPWTPKRVAGSKGLPLAGSRGSAPGLPSPPRRVDTSLQAARPSRIPILPHTIQ